MVKWLTVHNDGEVVPDSEGVYAKRAEMEKALALIAEMKEMLVYTGSHCDLRDDYEACMRLVCQAEVLLRD